MRKKLPGEYLGTFATRIPEVQNIKFFAPSIILLKCFTPQTLIFNFVGDKVLYLSIS